MGNSAEKASPNPHFVHGELQHEEGRSQHHHHVRQADVEDAEKHTARSVAPSPVHPQHEGILEQAHHESKQGHEEESDASVVMVQLDGAVIDEPRCIVVVKCGVVEVIMRKILHDLLKKVS